MRTLQNATAVFCLACICAEIVSLLTAEGWPRRCIKSVAGLYILVVLLQAAPQLRAQWSAFAVPQAAAADFGTAQQAVLREAETQLAETLEAQCLEQTGVRLRLSVSLAQNGTQVEAKAVQAIPAAGTSGQQKEAAAAYLRQALGVEPEFGKEAGT